MALTVKAACAALCAALLALTIRRSNPELALAVTGLAAVSVACLALEAAAGLRETVEQAVACCGLEAAVLTPVLKCVGAAIVTRLAGDLCRDAGQAALCTAVELAGTAAALLCAAPLFQTVLRTITAYGG